MFVKCVDEGKFPFLISCNLIGRERSCDLGLFTQLSLCKQTYSVPDLLKVIHESMILLTDNLVLSTEFLLKRIFCKKIVKRIAI